LLIHFKKFAKEKESVMNVHGIRQDFLEEGKRRGRAIDSIKDDTAQSSTKPSNGKIYFCGKFLCAKRIRDNDRIGICVQELLVKRNHHYHTRQIPLLRPAEYSVQNQGSNHVEDLPVRNLFLAI